MCATFFGDRPHSCGCPVPSPACTLAPSRSNKRPALHRDQGGRNEETSLRYRYCRTSGGSRLTVRCSVVATAWRIQCRRRPVRALRGLRHGAVGTKWRRKRWQRLRALTAQCDNRPFLHRFVDLCRHGSKQCFATVRQPYHIAPPKVRVGLLRDKTWSRLAPAGPVRQVIQIAR